MGPWDPRRRTGLLLEGAGPRARGKALRTERQQPGNGQPAQPSCSKAPPGPPATGSTVLSTSETSACCKSMNIIAARWQLLINALCNSSLLKQASVDYSSSSRLSDPCPLLHPACAGPAGSMLCVCVRPRHPAWHRSTGRAVGPPGLGTPAPAPVGDRGGGLFRTAHQRSGKAPSQP